MAKNRSAGKRGCSCERTYRRARVVSGLGPAGRTDYPGPVVGVRCKGKSGRLDLNQVVGIGFDLFKSGPSDPNGRLGSDGQLSSVPLAASGDVARAHGEGPPKTVAQAHWGAQGTGKGSGRSGGVWQARAWTRCWSRGTRG
jgi:hypothetical protein